MWLRCPFWRLDVSAVHSVSCRRGREEEEEDVDIDPREEEAERRRLPLNQIR